MIQTSTHHLAEVDLQTLICPLFVVPGQGKKVRVQDMPGIYRFSVDRLVHKVSQLVDLGLQTFLLFGVPDKKDGQGSGACTENMVTRAIRGLKARWPHITVMTDVCLCAYTRHGHCGVIPQGHQRIDQDRTLKALADMAAMHAQAGADYVAPSAMTAGQVRVIRERLNEQGLQKTKIMGYSAKFASSFYGPFRQAAKSAPVFGDRRGYQLDYRSARKALVKVEEDIVGGADIVMVKPALGYLDVIRQVRDAFVKPLAVYNVSGEYALVKTGARSRLWQEQDMISEIMASFKRAGADYIITYHAEEMGSWQKQR